MNAALPRQTDWPAAAVTTEHSPPVHFTYGMCCPKPIVTKGRHKCRVYNEDGSPNMHNPLYGQLVVNRYDELGMSSNLTDCVEELDGVSWTAYFADFVAGL